MSIKTKATRGGAAIAALLVVTILVTAWGTNRIRMGGPLQQENQMMSDFTADILPPPVFLVEAFLETSLLVYEPGEYEIHRANLERLEADYRRRADYWADSALPADLKQSLLSGSGAQGEQFWQEVNATLLPAIRRGDQAATTASFARLEAIFNAHKAEVQQLVALTAEGQQNVSANSGTALAITLVLNALMALATLAAILFALRALKREALEPLHDTAEVMRRMAGGDLNAGADTASRDDEIGEMISAIEVFRATARSQRDAERNQHDVVAGISNGLQEMAAGNLQHRITSEFAAEYEPLRHAFNSTIEQLGQLVAHVASTASSVNNGATEIRAASEDLALRNEQQAASVAATAAAIKALSQGIEAANTNASSLVNMIGNAQQEAADGGEVLARTVSAMDAIEQSAQQISQIIGVIDGIAFQTNLLALNAGVEAARAGDSGKGFAVVANEVRALAQRTTDAARDIKGLISTSTEQVDTGVQLVSQTGLVLERIGSRVSEAGKLVEQIEIGVATRAKSIDMLHGSAVELDSMTQRNAAMAEQSTAAARSLTSESTELTELVAHFRSGIELGQTSGRAVPVAIRPAIRSSPRSSPRSAASGSLALAVSPADEDWSEF